MGTIAIGDVHGNLAALKDLLGRITPEIGAEDTVVFLGDYVDRGPDTKACIDKILDFRFGLKTPVVALLGNHEEWLMRTYEDYTRHSWILGMEAFETIHSYSPAAAIRLRQEAEKAGPRLVLERVVLPYEIFFETVPFEHITFLRSLQTFCRTSDALCVHGGLDPEGGPVEGQPSEYLVWGTDNFPQHYTGKDMVLYGHADDPLLDENGWPHPRIIGRTFGLDTISKGVLTALRLPERTLYQSGRFS